MNVPPSPTIEPTAPLITVPAVVVAPGAASCAEFPADSVRHRFGA